MLGCSLKGCLSLCFPDVACFAGSSGEGLEAGNGGHAVARLTRTGMPTLRAPVAQKALSNGKDSVTFESYDDRDFGYLRILVNGAQLRIEYHPASDGQDAKTPDDFVTVELASRKLVHFVTH